MGKRLVTIATFDQPAQARMAQNALQEAGILATVNDESLVTMDWLLSNAVGGVKVQVWEEDAEKAVAVLEQKFGEDGEGFGSKVAPEELAAEAEAATVVDGEEPPPAHPEAGAEVPESSVAAESCDWYARRMVFTSVLGLLFPPIAFFAIYLFLNAVFGEGRLSSRGRFHLAIGGMMTLAGLVVFPFYLSLIFR